MSLFRSPVGGGRVWLIIALALGVGLAACTANETTSSVAGSDADAPGATSEPSATVDVQPTAVTPVATPTGLEPTPTLPGPSPTMTVGPTPTSEPPPQTPEPLTHIVAEVTGPIETVFDWATDRCEPEHIPDIATRAFSDVDGTVQLTIGHYVNYRMVGPSLDALTSDCSVLLASNFDPDPSTFDDSVWLAGLYSADGETIHAVVHNEYRGDTHGATRPQQCPSQDRFTCLDTSLTMYISRDGGDSYEPIAPPPNHLIASLPYVFDDEGRPTGLRQPSNIVQGPDGYFYVFANASTYPVEEQWMCAMRTDDLDDPGSWRYWTGTDFTGVFINPYLQDPATGDECAPLAFDQLWVNIGETVIYAENIERFVAFGTAVAPSGGSFGVYYSTSADLVNWSNRKRLKDLTAYADPSDYESRPFFAYTSFIDTDSPSRNFDTTDGTGYLYMTSFNAGTFSLDRDLLRWPVEIRREPVPRPDWQFDSDGDSEGWVELNQSGGFGAKGGSLVTGSTGDDLSIGRDISIDSTLPSSFDQIRIRLSISEADGATAGTDAVQLFFGTESEPLYSEAASFIVTVPTDGDFHEVTIDLATNPLWAGLISSIRLDPGTRPGQGIEIDRVWFPDP